MMVNIMIFDTHSHLFSEEFDDDRIECLKRCEELNMKIMFVGYSHSGNQKAYDLAKLSPNYYCSAGIHPDQASPSYLEDFNLLRNFLDTHEIDALGEIGLDYHYDDGPSKEYQIPLFKLQLEEAKRRNIPVIIHTRDAWKDTMDILKPYANDIKCILHCYSGSLEMAREFIKMGFYIAIGGAVTFKNSKEIKRVCENIDMNYMLVETDCPYITPHPFRGKRNESAYIKYTIEEIAKIRNMSVLDIENITYNNACKAFNLEVNHEKN